MRALVAALGLLSACVAEAPRVPSAVSSTIARDPITGTLWVTSPDDDTLVEIDPADGTERSRVAVPGEPQELARVDEAWLVTLGRHGGVARVQDGSSVEIAVPCAWTRSIASLEGRTFVSCPDDDRVVEIDARTRALVGVRDVPGEPTALAIAGHTLAITTSRGRQLVTFDLDAADAPAHASPLPVESGRAASQPLALTVEPHGGFVAIYQSVANDGPRDLPPESGGYGALVDGSPRIEPRVLGPCGDRYARFDGGELAMSGPSAVAVAGGLVWIASLSTDNVLVARCTPTSDAVASGALDVLATFRVGRAPRGIALSEDGRSAFVDVGFDWAVARLDAPASRAPSRLEASWTRRRTLGTAHLSASALRGRSLFFDAVDTHLTPSGVVTCGTCHPRGGDDGLSWFLHTPNVPRKLRRTPPAWGGRPSLAPYHWDGAFTDAATLAQTTTHELMNGDGLLVAFDDLAAYLEELEPPPARAPDDTSAVQRGAALFASAGCATCHAGASLADGLAHPNVVPTSSDPDAVLASVETPTLIAVRTHPPFFHDGSAATLRDTLRVPGDTHGATSALTENELDDLVTYLESL